LVYNATLGAWLPVVGASGSFLAGIQTVTVVNGIITSIV
jgi:homoserine dehydrogenase